MQQRMRHLGVSFSVPVIPASHLPFLLQVIHTESRVGMHKATSAAMSCTALNSGVTIEQHLEGFTPANAVQIVQQYDVVLDASDNPPTRYLIRYTVALHGMQIMWNLCHAQQLCPLLAGLYINQEDD